MNNQPALLLSCHFQKLVTLLHSFKLPPWAHFLVQESDAQLGLPSFCRVGQGQGSVAEHAPELPQLSKKRMRRIVYGRFHT